MPLRPSGRRIAAADTIWLDMDRDTNLMVIESLLLLESPIDVDRFLDLLEERVLGRYPVFGCRPEPDRLLPGRSRWVESPDFDLADHVVHARLRSPRDDVALQRYVERRVALPLRRDRPLWEVHLVDGYGEGSAVYARVHHSLADGMALMQVLLSLTDDAPDPDGTDLSAMLLRPTVIRLPTPPDEAGLAARVAHAAEGLLSGTAAAVDLARNTLTPDGLRRLAGTAEQSLAIARKLLLAPRPAGPLDGPPGEEKRVLWSEPLPLADLRDAARRTGTTINDVVVAALAGALASYLRQHHGAAVDVPTMVPVNLRPPDRPLPQWLGNRFALVLLSLPSALPTPFERLAETKRRMDAIKASPEPLVTHVTSRAIGATNGRAERRLVDFFANKAVGVTTDVIGPDHRRWLAGVPVTGMLAWAPESGDQVLGTCLVTYAGTLRVGFKVDAWQVPAPEGLVAAFRDEVAVLLRLAAA